MAQDGREAPVRYRRGRDAGGADLVNRGSIAVSGNTSLVSNPVNKNWWPRKRDHQLLLKEELWRYY